MSKLDRTSPSLLTTNPRATASAWSKYSSLVLSAYAASPHVYTFTPTSSTPATVASRLRDAIRGMLAFSYPGCEVSVTDLARWYESVVVRFDKQNVYIGPREVLKSELQGETRAKESNRLIFDSLDPNEIQAFELLLSSGRISGPVLIKNPPSDLFPSHSERLIRPDGSLVLL